jgi:hypothetical protein
MVKGLVVLHRYLGVGLGLLMTVWCLSGFVMMYQGFPETTREERIAGLARLDAGAWLGPEKLTLPDDATVESFRIEAVGGRPVLHIAGDGPPQRMLLDTGAPLEALGKDDIAAIASAFASANGREGPLAGLNPIRVDQWTTGIWTRHSPLWKATFGDRGRSYVYVNGASGEVVQDALSRERLLSWFGAIPHWLYPTLLRQNAPLWSQVVIWSALLGTFLTLTGIIVGVARLRGKSGRWFPNRRPMWLLHHVLGTIAGLLVLTWTFSGLLTMQPWGLFTSQPSISRSDLTGALSGRDVKALVAVAHDLSSMGDLVQVRSAPLLGEAAAILRWRDGSETRIGLADAAPLDPATIALRLSQAGGALAGARVDVLAIEDAYYYGHKQGVPLPVLRIRLADADATRVYVDATTGDVRRIADATAQRYRWLESAFHSFDWPGLRTRPLWDGVVLFLLATVTLVCATGAWLSFTRIGRDVSGLRSILRRRREELASDSGATGRDSGTPGAKETT